MKTVTMYGEDDAIIIVNETDVDYYKSLGFSRKKKAKAVKKSDVDVPMTDSTTVNEDVSMLKGAKGKAKE